MSSVNSNCCYLVYPDGNVFSFISNKILKQADTGRGYKFVKIDQKNRYVHKLVAEAFLPKPVGRENENLEIDHIDRNASNNNVENLRWVSRSENLLNRGVFKNNKLGITNLCKINGRYSFCKIIRGKRRQKWFHTLEEAIAFKEEHEAYYKKVDGIV